MQMYVLQLYFSCSSIRVTLQRERYQNYCKAAVCSEQGRWAGFIFHLILTAYRRGHRACSSDSLPAGVPGEAVISAPVQK